MAEPPRLDLLVCVGPSPTSERLIRETHRMAAAEASTWSAATVEVTNAPPLAARDREQLESHLRLVESLGGEVHRLHGAAVPEVLLAHARAHGVTRIVAGKPTHGRWRDRLGGSLLDTLIRGSGSIEVHVLAPLATAPALAIAHQRDTRRGWRAYALAIGGVAIVTGLGLATFDALSLADLTMLYLIAIAAGSLFGRGPSLVAASLSVAAYDFCFVAPRFTFAVSGVRQLLTFFVMFGCGIAISTLTVRLRRQERNAIVRERRTAALLAFTREVGSALTEPDVAAVTARHLEDAFDIAAAVLVPHATEGLVAAAGLGALAEREVAVARWAFDHQEVAGHETATLADARALCVPILDGDRALGVLALQGQPTVTFDRDARHFIDAIARQAALALAHVRLVAEAKEAALRATTEELRSSLLSAVSHDLRTPLAVITGAATTLRDREAELDPAARGELLASIVDDARRLERVLGNLLQLTRVETGFRPTCELVPAEEVVGAALTRLESAIGEWRVDLDVAPDLALWIDPVLFEQVLINLVENALKHGGAPLAIAARRSGDRVELDVADRGPGLPPDATRLFDKFVRASTATAPGVGLGLAVVRAIVTAHGGEVAALANPGGGALFRVTLPVRSA